jgi:predicted dehydrogenase
MTDTSTTRRTIRVGIIGAGWWAQTGHLPILNFLDRFEVVAVSSRRMAQAEELAATFNIAHAFDDAHQLIDHPDVDLVVVTTPPHERPDLVKRAIAAGKDVCAEWPLTTTTVESEELLSLAEEKGVRHIVAMQRRFSPTVRYLRDLINQGYIGRVRSANMTYSTSVFSPTRPQKIAWTADASNFMNVLTTHGGQQMDLLFHLVGPPKKLTAVLETQFPIITVQETGQTIANEAPDAAMAIGSLENGGLVTMTIIGGTPHDPGILIHITGADGALKLTSPFGNAADFVLEGAHGDQTELSPLPTPAEYQLNPSPSLDASVEDLAVLYEAYVHDSENGTSEATTFNDAVALHRTLDQIEQTSKRFSD